jgi:pimeloyl-ACP methyl ester carboxylesterase
VILPDLPGHGFSEPPTVHTRAAFHDALFDALDAVVTEPVVVFGNSLGGYAALRFALERPTRVSALFLASPAGAAMSGEEIAALRRLFRLTSQADAVAFVDRLLARRRWIRRPMAWGLRHQFNRPEVEAVLELAAQEHFLTPEELARLTIPVLLSWGREDRILPPQSLEFFRRHLPRHSRIEEPEGFGHSPFLDAPGRFAERLVRFGQELGLEPAAQH